MTLLTISGICWIYFTIAGFMMKFMNGDETFQWKEFVMDLLWPIFAPYRLMNFFLGQPVELKKFYKDPFYRF